MTHSKATLEAISQMSMGLIEYNRGVLSAIGKADLGNTWKFASREREAAGDALTQCIDKKHEGSDELTKLLDPGSEFVAETARLDAANARCTEVWNEIQSIINDAQDALFR